MSKTPYLPNPRTVLATATAAGATIAIVLTSASDTFKPEGTGADCGYSCHTIVKAKDYVFTAYGKR